MLHVFVASLMLSYSGASVEEGQCQPISSVSAASPGETFIFEWVSNSPRPHGAYLGYTITAVEENTVFANEWTYIHTSGGPLNWDALIQQMNVTPIAREFSIFHSEFNQPGDRDLYRSFSYELDLTEVLQGLTVGEQVVVPTTETSVLRGARRSSESDLVISFEGCAQIEFSGQMREVTQYRIQSSILTRDENGTFGEAESDTIYSIDEALGWWVHAQYPTGQMVLRAHIADD